MVTTPVFEHLFNIGQGLKSFDTSGNHRHSVLSGNPSWVAGRKGKAIALDGTDDAFVAPVPENVNKDFTVAFWVQNWVPGSDGAGLGILALQSAPDIHTSNNTVIIYKDSITGEVKVICYTSGYTQQILSSGSTTKSGFMCIRRNGATVNFFLNGAFVAERTVTEIREFTWLLVGLTSYNYTKADWIDKIRYWDSALSDEEIEYWYAKDKPRWNDSCVLWLRGDEAHGVVVKDYSPKGNDGALTATLNDGAITGASWVVDEEKGKCLSFDGVNDKVLIPYDASTSPVDDSFSWCFWVKNAFGDNTYPFSTMGINGYYIRVTDNGTLVFVQYNGTNVKSIYGVTSVPLDEWAHCVVVRDVDTGLCRMYVNGVKIHEKSHGEFTLDRVLSVYVQNVSFYGWYGKGLLRDLRMYRKALTDDEVSALYNRTAEVSYGCVGKWLLNEGEGSIAYDSHNRFPAKRGNGVNFNGVDEKCLVNDSNSLDVRREITCCAWIKTTKTSKQAVLAKSGAYLFYVGTVTAGRIHAYMYGDSTWRYGNTNVCDGVKHHIAVTFNSMEASDNMRFYLDGESDGVESASPTIISATSTKLGVGYRDTVDYYDYFRELIDDAMIFNRALTATEIKRVYMADGFLDYIPLQIQDGSLTVNVDSVGVQWDSWAGGACRRKHLGLGKNVAYTFTAIEEPADVPWLDSAAYILKEKKDAGTPVDLYIKKTDVLAAESTSVVIDSMNVRYSPTMQVRYIDFSVREQ